MFHAILQSIDSSLEQNVKFYYKKHELNRWCLIKQNIYNM